MTNAEKLSKMVTENNNVKIWPIPNAEYWCVLYKSTKTSYKVILCKPNQRSWRLITKKASLKEAKLLYKELLDISLSNKINIAITESRKYIKNNKQNKKYDRVPKQNQSR